MAFLKRLLVSVGVLTVVGLASWGVLLEVEHHRQSKLMWDFFAEILIVVDHPEAGKVPLTRADILRIITSEALKKESQ